MDALSNLGTLFSGPAGNLLRGGLTGAGLIGNIMDQKKQEDALNRIAFYQKNPAAAAQMVNSMTAPLTSGLTQEVGNATQGYLAERGLSQSPNISAFTNDQALAPYAQQNQAQALALFQNLLNPAGAKYGTPMDLSKLFGLFKPAPATGANPAGPVPPIGGTPPFFPSGTNVYSDSPTIDMNAGDQLG